MYIYICHIYLCFGRLRKRSCNRKHVHNTQLDPFVVRSNFEFVIGERVEMKNKTNITAKPQSPLRTQNKKQERKNTNLTND